MKRNKSRRVHSSCISDIEAARNPVASKEDVSDIVSDILFQLVHAVSEDAAECVSKSPPEPVLVLEEKLNQELFNPCNSEIEVAQNPAVATEDVSNIVSDILFQVLHTVSEDVAECVSESPLEPCTIFVSEEKSVLASKDLSYPIPEVCNSNTFIENSNKVDNASLQSVPEVVSNNKSILHNKENSHEEVCDFPTETSNSQITVDLVHAAESDSQTISQYAAESDSQTISQSALPYEEEVDWQSASPDSHKDFFESLKLLDGNQVTFAMHVLKCLRNNHLFHYFLSGLAGTGKSYVVKILAKLVELVYPVSTGLRSVLVMAPTVKTASIVNGMTIEEALAIPLLCHESPILPELPNCILEFLRSQFKSVKLIIIDEISSVGKCLISHVDARLKQIFDVANDFGNLPILLVGDLHQVPPKDDSPIFKNIPLWENFKYYELQTIMRHGDDPDFFRILDHFSGGELTKDDLEILNQRNFAVHECLICPCIKNVYVFCDVDEVNCFNNYALENLHGSGFTSIAEDQLLGPVNSENAGSLIKYFESKPLSDIEGLPHSLLLKGSAKYMISHDIDVAAGLGAGVIGIIRSLTVEENKIQEIVFEVEDFVPFPNLKKRKYKKPYGTNLVVIKKISCVLRHNFLHNLTYERRQFPLIPAEAVHINDIRGRSASCICIPIDSSVKMRSNILYTALSRAKSLKNLHFIGCITEAHSIKDEELNSELLRLRNNALLTIKDPHFGEEFHRIAQDFTVCYQNLTNLTSEHSQMFADFLKNVLNSLCRYHNVVIFKGNFSQEEVALLCDKCEEAGFSSVFSLYSPRKQKRLHKRIHNFRKPRILFFSRVCFYTVERLVRMENLGRSTQLCALVKINSLYILCGSDIPKYHTERILRKYLSDINNLIVIGGFRPSYLLNSCFQNLELVKAIKLSNDSYNSILTNIKPYQFQLHCLPLYHKYHWPLCIGVSSKHSKNQ